VDTRIYRQSDPEYLLALLLRYRVLRVPLGLTFSSGDLVKDKDDIHVGTFADDTILATLILTDTGDHTIKMRQVAVDEAQQGKGLGRSLALYAEHYARDRGYQLIHCHARDVAKDFYLKLGYSISGEPFTEVGIKHFHMEKKL
jgi:predicted GNAT family N-acyltransferase